MAEIKKPATSEKGYVGHQVTGKVAILHGSVKAVSPDGTARMLKINSPVFADDHIITGDDGSVSIVFDTSQHTQLDLGRMSNVVIDEDVYGVASSDVSADASAEQEAIQKALLAGDQPLELDATAAGAEANAGGGHPVFVVTPDWVHVTPESGAETTGVKFGAMDSTNYNPNVEEPTNAPPTITVDTGTGGGSGGGSGSGNGSGSTDHSNADGNDVVYEAGLAAGSDHTATTNAHGTITLSDPDGLGDIQSVTINGTEIAIGYLTGTMSTVINGTNGTLTVTGYDSTTGVATYTYHLTSPTTDGPGPETEVFTLTTSDGTATSAPATITIEIIDDLPNAVDDFDSIGKDDASAHTGNVFTNDLHPNGEPGADIPASFESWTGSTTASYGTFVPGADGTYSYTLDTTNPTVQALQGGQILTETFNYQIHDADGDVDTASLTITIVGANDAPLPVFTINDVTVNEGDGTITFTVTKTGLTDQVSSVDYNVNPNSAVTPADYTAGTSPLAGTLNFAAGQTTQTITLNITPDQIYELTENFHVDLSNAVNATISDSQGIGTILDNYTPPGVSITTGINGGWAYEGNQVKFTVTQDQVSTEDTLVKVKVFTGAADTATEGADYTAASVTYMDVIIHAGNTSADFFVDTKVDTLDEGSETFTAQIMDATNPNGSVTIGTAAATGTILDTNVPEVDITTGINGGWAYEGNQVKFTVTQDQVSTEDTLVKVKVFTGAADTATEGADYTAASVTYMDVIIHAGNTSADFFVDTKVDTLDEGSETFTAQIMDATNPNGSVTIGTAAATGTILDTNVPEVDITTGINGGWAYEGNQVKFTVTQDQVSTEDTLVKVKVFTGAADTATEGADYTAATVTYMDVIIHAGNTSADFFVDTKVDTLDEGSETFTAQIMDATNPNGSVTIGTAAATGTILDTNVPEVDITTGIDGGWAYEGNQVKFTVTQDQVSDEDTLVKVKVFTGAADTATEGADYTAASVTYMDVIIHAGNTSADFFVDTKVDTLDEGSETFTAQIMDATNPNGSVTIGTAAATGTILDTNVPEVDITTGINGGWAYEGNQVKFTVTQDQVSTEDTLVKVKVFTGAADTATEGADYTAASVTYMDVIIHAGNTSADFFVDTKVDTLDEGSETFTAQIMDATNPNGSVTIGTAAATGTILDTNVPEVDITTGINGGWAYEGNQVKFTVTQDQVSTEDTLVKVKVFTGAADTATEGADYTAASVTYMDVIIHAGNTSADFFVDTKVDTLDEGSETFTAQIMDATNPNGSVTIGTAAATGTILDTNVPEVDITTGINGGWAYEGNQVKFTVTQDQVSTEDTLVKVKVFTGAADTATEGADYTAASVTYMDVIIHAGNTSADFFVDTKVDTLDEGSETFTAQIMDATNPNGSVTIGTAAATGTILDTNVPEVDITTGINGGWAYEGNQVKFTVTQDQVSTEDTLVKVKVFTGAADTATEGADYTAASVTYMDVIIHAGNTSADFFVDTKVDTLDEGSETFTAQIMDATNPNGSVTIGTAAATGTILDTNVPEVDITTGINGGWAYEGNQVKFTVTQDQVSTEDTLVKVKVFTGAADTATEGADYTAASVTYMDVIIHAGNTSADFFVDTKVDTLDEGSETFTAQIMDATNPNGSVTIGTAAATGTILDTNVPEVDITTGINGGWAYEGNQVKFTVTQDQVSTEDTLVKVKVFTGAADTATEGADYTAASVTYMDVIIHAGNTSADFFVDTKVDTLDEGSETFTAQIMDATNPNGSVTIGTAAATGTILDTNVPEVDITTGINGGWAYEGNQVKFTVTQDQVSTEDTLVKVKVFTGAADTATEGADYTAASVTYMDVIIHAGNTSADFFVDTKVDTLDEGSETFTAQIMDATNPNGSVTIGTAAATGTILDTNVPEVDITTGINGGWAYEGNQVKFTVTQDQVSTEDTLVKVKVFTGAADTATEGADYTAASVTYMDVIIHAGNTSADFFVDTKVDTLDEGSETFTAQIMDATNPNGSVTIGTAAATGTILDTNVPEVDITTGINGGWAYEGNQVKFTVTQDQVSTEDTLVKVKVFTGAADTATEGADYTAASVTYMDVIIHAGNTSADFFVDTKVDTLDEGSETFTAQIMDATNPNGSVTIGTAAATGTILDTNVPEVDITTGINGGWAYEGNQVKFTVTQDQVSTEDTLVKVKVFTGAADTATEGADYTAASVTYMDVIIHAGNTSADFFVDTKVDTLDEGSETFTAQIMDATNPNGSVTIGTAAATGTILDTNVPEVDITTGINGGWAYEGNQVKFTVTQDQVSTEDTLVKVKVFTGAADTATEGADYTAASVTYMDVIIHAGNTSADFFVDTKVDTLDEGSETFTAQIMDATNPNGSVTIGTAAATGTILDTNVPEVDITTGINGGWAYEGNQVKFTVTQDQVSTEDTLVKVKVFTGAADTATEGADYTAASVTYMDVIIHAGNTSADFFVDTKVDTLDEGSETFTAQIMDATNPNGSVTIGTAAATGTILDTNVPEVDITTGINGGWAYEGNQVKFTVTQDQVSTEDTLVKVKVFTGAADTATEGADYTAASVTYMDVIIHAGNTSADFFVDTKVDTLDEGSETFTAQIMDATNPNGSVTIGTAAATGTILDTNVPEVDITTGINGGWAYEGNQVKFTVTQDQVSTEDTLVKVKVFTGAADTATEGADYTAASVTYMDVIIHAGNTSADFFVDTKVDTLDEGSETFTAQIMDATNPNGSVTIGTAAATGTILDTNVPEVDITTGINGGWAYEGNQVKFTVTQDQVSTEDTHVWVKVIGVMGDTATVNLDYTKITLLDVVIHAGSTSATFDVSTLVDTLKEGNETFTAQIDHVTNANGTPSIGTGSALGTILDNYTDIQPTAGVSYAYVDDDGLPNGNPASTTGDYVVPNIDGDGSEATFSGTLNFTPGNIPATINAFAEMNEKTGTVGQEIVTYSWNSGTETLTATGPRGVLFKVQMTDTTTGAYKVTLVDNVLHETLNGQVGDNTENDATATLKYTVTDNDGQTAAGTLNIVFDDDMPTAYSKMDSVTIEKAAVTAQVSALASGWDAPYDTNVDTKTSTDSDPYYEKIAWGDTSNSSSYVFNDNNSLSTVNVGEKFTLGTFTHNNFTIPSGSAITNAYLRVTFNVQIEGETVPVDKLVHFQHNETPNSSDPVASADIVTIVDGTNIVHITTPRGFTYTLTIGFQDAGGNTVTQVHTLENAATSFNLNATLTADSGHYALPVTGTIDADFGADGPAVMKIVSIAHDSEVYNTSSAGYNAATTTLTLTTHEGGTLTMNFSTGAYTYHAPTGLLGDASEVFAYTVEDADGDASTANLTINVAGEHVPTVGGNMVVQLDDDALAGGNPGGVGDVTPDTAHTSGTLTHSFGGDGAGSITYLTNGAPSGFTYELSSGNLLVKQGTTTVMTLTVNSTTGAYTVTQNAPVDHASLQGENSQDFTIGYRVTDSNGDHANGTININVNDDTPIAGAQSVVVEANSSSTGTNLLLIVDTTGSMKDNPGVAGYTTKLALEKAALNQLINEYDSHGDVMVRLVTFHDAKAYIDTNGWMTASQAISVINGLSASGNTNYDAALLSAKTAFVTSGAISGGQNISYFLSDGAPNASSTWPGVSGSGENGINAPEETSWESFLTTNHITSFALGLGSGTTTSKLDPVAYDGLNGVEKSSMVVTDLSQLSAVLLGTVIIPSSVEGNLITGSVDVSFGADGPATLKIVSIAHDANGDGTAEVYNTSSAGYNAAATELTITTHEGGKLIVDFSTGEYKYTAPTNLTANTKETFTYTIADGDGDTASSALKIHLLPAESTHDYSASSSGVTASATAAEPNIIGSDHNDVLTGDSHVNFLVGGAGDDTLSGGAGNDFLSGGTGYNTLTGGSGADTFMISKDGHDKITDYSKGDFDKVDISNVLNTDAGDYLHVVNEGGHVKLEILNSSHVEKASVSFETIHFSDLTPGDELNSLLGKVDVDHHG